MFVDFILFSNYAVNIKVVFTFSLLLYLIASKVTPLIAYSSRRRLIYAPRRRGCRDPARVERDRGGRGEGHEHDDDEHEHRAWHD